MFNPDTAPASAYMPSLETAARSLKVAPIIAPVHSDGEIETAITALGREPGGGLVCLPEGGFTQNAIDIGGATKVVCQVGSVGKQPPSLAKAACE